MTEIVEGRKLRDEGMATADRHVDAAWKAVAGATLLSLARLGRPEITAEDVTAVAGLPVSRNAIGALFGTWAGRGVIREVGRKQSGRKDRHAGKITIWAGVPEEAVKWQDAAPAVIPEPQGQQSLFESAWRCSTCDVEIAETVVTRYDIAPKYGQAWCPRCLKKRQVQFR